MKTKLVAIAALLLASVYPSTASADVAPTGKLGAVTIAFTFTYDVGGFAGKPKDVKTSKGSYWKPISFTDTLHKELYSSILTTTKYGNLQLFSDLVNNEYFNSESKAADWSLVYVQASGGGGEMRGFFAVNKKTSQVVFVGGYDESCFPINLVSKDGSGYTETHTDMSTYADSGMTTLTNTSVGASKGVESYCLKFKPYNNSTTFRAYALLFSQGTWSDDYINPDNSTYTAAPTIVSGIVGDDGDGTIIGGGLSVNSLHPIKDVSAYINAYNDSHNG